MTQSKKILVTGAAGFIGSHLAEALVERGHSVRALIRYNSRNNWGWLEQSEYRSKIKVVRGDIRDYDFVHSAIEGCDTVFHCAYGNTNNSVLNNRINEEGTTNICEIALKKGIKKLIYISSVAVYGRNPPSVVSEETPTVFSDDEYSNSKIRAEKICFDFFDRGLSIIIVDQGS